MKSKKCPALALLITLAIAFTGCSGKKIDVDTPATEQTTSEQSTNTEEKTASAKKVGLVLTTAGLGDKNFNDMSFQGMQMGEKELGIPFDYAEPKAATDYETVTRQYAESGEYSLIIVLGADQIDSLTKVATDFPEQKFTIIDANVDLPNVSSIFTYQQEQTFLSGVLAGLVTTDTANFPLANPEKHVGIIVGMDTPIQLAAQAGFVAGAKFVDKDIIVDQTVAGSFSDPAKGISLASGMYSTGADVVQHFAGATGLGVFTAAKNENKYAIGAGMSQNPIDPEHIICTSERKVYEIVFSEIKKINEDSWKPGVLNLGLAQNAVGYTFEGTNIAIPENIKSQMEKIKAYIIDNNIQIPSKSEEVDAWIQEHNISKIK